MSDHDAMRRRLLLAAGGLTASGLVPRLSGLALPGAYAQAAQDYKAMVCVFLYGGADSNDMVVPLDGYSAYDAVRGRGGMGLDAGELVPILPASPARRFGFHPALGDLAPIFTARKAACYAPAAQTPL